MIWPNLYNFSNKLPCLRIWMNFSRKSCKRCLISWKTTRNHRSGQIFITFRTNYHVFPFRWTFQRNVAKSASFREKAREIIDLGKLCNFSNKLPCLCISINFSGKSCKKCLISWKSTKNHRSGQNFATFRTNYHVFAFRLTFQEKVAKSASFGEKTRKTIDLAKTCNFSSKLPCLGIFVYFSERSCKKCLIPWKSTRNHRFCQHYATFRTNYHVFAFRWTFKEKVGESGSFREKARKIMDLVKTCNFSNKLPCFGVSMNFSTKCCRNCLISWKSTKTDRFGQDYATFSNKLPCFGVAMNFSAKGCKKCLISWKSTRNHRSGQNFATFRTTTMSLHFDELFRKKLQKVPHLVKKHEKSSIWPKPCNFSNKLPCLCISMNFSEKSCKKCLISWKNTKNHRFGQNYATFSNKLPCFGVAMNFSAKGCKKCLISWKSTRNHRSGQNFATFRTTTMSLHFDELFKKKLQKVPHLVKKHEKSSIWPTLYNFSNKLPCLCISMNFSEKSCKKCLISWKNTKNHRFGQNYATFSNKLPCFGVAMNFSAKGCKKCLISWKSTRNHRSGQNFATFRTTTMSLHFDELFKKKLQKVPHLVKKHEKSSIWPTLYNFSNKLPCLCISMNFSEKSCKKCLISWKNTKNHRFGQNYATFSNKLPCFGVAMNFSAKGCKKWLNSWKSTKYHRFGQNFATFPTTTMSLDFDQLFRKKLQKVPHFVK